MSGGLSLILGLGLAGNTGGGGMFMDDLGRRHFFDDLNRWLFWDDLDRRVA
jgi:hypothetical protein